MRTSEMKSNCEKLRAANKRQYIYNTSTYKHTTYTATQFEV